MRTSEPFFKKRRSRKSFIDNTRTYKYKKMKSSVSNYVKIIGGFFVLAASLFMPGACHKSNTPGNTTDTVVTAPPNMPPPPVAKGPAFTTDTLVGNGVDLQPSYYNGGNVTFGYPLMLQNPKIKSVRIEIEPFVPVSLAASWIQQARSNGYKVIATYHKYMVLGSDDTTQLDTAANWWKTNYATLAAAGSFTVNLMNEWGSHNLTPAGYAQAYNQAIAIVRQVYQGPIILDCPGYGQETSVAANAVTGTGTGGAKITDTNIILSAHIYPNGYNQAHGHIFQQSDLDDLAASGRACIVGEFGNSPTGSVDWMGMVGYAKSKKWAVLGWSWNGDGGTMNMVTPAWDAQANASSYSQSSYFAVIYSLL
jgi:mannan endo-1,4-beta-mannosidase